MEKLGLMALACFDFSKYKYNYKEKKQKQICKLQGLMPKGGLGGAPGVV